MNYALLYHKLTVSNNEKALLLLVISTEPADSAGKRRDPANLARTIDYGILRQAQDDS